MPFEVELKFRVSDPNPLSARLPACGGVAEHQYDLYLTHPDRDFAQSGEAFRIRRAGESNVLTYKGPRRDGPTKTREEIELAFQSGTDAFQAMAGLLERLGFRPVREVQKARLSHDLQFHGRPMTVTLDQVEALGIFAEVETIAADAKDLPAAQRAVRQLADELGLVDVEPRSYLRMLIEQDQSR